MLVNTSDFYRMTISDSSALMDIPPATVQLGSVAIKRGGIEDTAFYIAREVEESELPLIGSRIVNPSCEQQEFICLLKHLGKRHTTCELIDGEELCQEEFNDGCTSRLLTIVEFRQIREIFTGCILGYDPDDVYFDELYEFTDKALQERKDLKEAPDEN